MASRYFPQEAQSHWFSGYRDTKLLTEATNNYIIELKNSYNKGIQFINKCFFLYVKENKLYLLFSMYNTIHDLTLTGVLRGKTICGN